MCKTLDAVCLTLEARPPQPLEVPDQYLIVGCIIAYKPTYLNLSKYKLVCLGTGLSSMKLGEKRLTFSAIPNFSTTGPTIPAR
jgi:hypothetical protein